MKTAVIPQVRVAQELRADLDLLLLPGETRTGVSIPSDILLSKLEAKVAAHVKQLRR